MLVAVEILQSDWTAIFFQQNKSGYRLAPDPPFREGWVTPDYSEPKQPSLPESPYKVRVVFSKPVHAARARIGPHCPNHGAFYTAKPSSHHVHITVTDLIK